MLQCAFVWGFELLVAVCVAVYVALCVAVRCVCCILCCSTWHLVLQCVAVGEWAVLACFCMGVCAGFRYPQNSPLHSHCSSKLKCVLKRVAACIAV